MIEMFSYCCSVVGAACGYSCSAYRKRALERNIIPLYTVDSLVRNDRLAVLKTRGNVNRLPLDWNLCPIVNAVATIIIRTMNVRLPPRKCPLLIARSRDRYRLPRSRLRCIFPAELSIRRHL